MRPDALPRLAGPTIICTQAGNVNTGAFDPYSEIIEQARRAGAWVHVDGAFACGPPRSPRWRTWPKAWRELTPGLPTLTSGSTYPTTLGWLSCETPDALRAAMAVTAEYLPPADGQRNPSDYTPSYLGARGA